MSGRRESEAVLRLIGEGPEHDIDIAGAALHLAALSRTQCDLAPYQAHLADIDARIGEAAAEAESAADAASRLAQVMAGVNRYRGDDQTYDDLQNADLISVIDRRKGLPVALGILYIDIARRRGWTAYGLNFPGHFLIALEHLGGRAIVDPFHEGVCREPHELRDLLKMVAGQDAELSADMYAAVPDRAVLLRLQSNIRLRLLQMRRYEAAAEIMDTMLLFAPQHGELWREAGMLQAQLGNLGAAIRALETSLEREPDGYRREETAALLARLRRRMN